MKPLKRLYYFLPTSLAFATLVHLVGCGEDSPPTVNRAPVFGEEAFTFTLAENAASGGEVGMVSATGEDSDELTYSITTTQTDFDIGTSTGAVAVAESAALDVETTASYTLEVQVSDGTATTDVTITNTSYNFSTRCGYGQWCRIGPNIGDRCGRHGHA